MFLTKLLKNRLHEGGVRSWGLFVRSMLINQHLPENTRTGRYANGTIDRKKKKLDTEWQML